MRSLYIILFVLCANLLSAQINTGALPASFKHNLSFEQVDHISLYPPNMELIRSEDAEAEKNGTMMKVARLIPFTANIDNSGTWERTSDGKNIWRLRVSSDGAKSCVLHFDEFELPQGSELFVYNPDRTVVLGPYTSTDNDDGGSYAIGVVYGQELIIEYIAPLAKSLTGQVKPIKPIIEMSAFSYFYRGAELYDNRASANFGSSGSCMVNANCSEGNNWRAQQKGVARIYVVEGGYGGWCSGTLVNNTNNDQTPYFLTADHCGGSATSYELGQWIFRFKYESAGCTATSEPSGSNITGCTKKARGPLSGGSDFLLLQLNTTSTNLKNIGVVYNGWTASPSASPSGVSFHHPSGDIKKVSTYTSQLTTVSYGDGAATGAHWMVNWASTAHGHSVTEGGSSGSPIFNNNGLVVGTLTGGSSYCTSPTSPDAYGKFSYHWTSNGTTNDKQLKPWLAPNSSATSCDYLDPNNVGLVCNFSGTPTNVTAGNSVSFTDLSTGGTITSRSWSFPGGSPSSSSSPSPTIIYNTPGTYNVSLTVSNGSQNATETKNGYITVAQSTTAPVANFTANTTSGCAPLTVSFSDQSSNNATSWSWIFNGATPSSSISPNPTVIYNTPGIYSVTLTASNAGGSNTKTMTNYITVNDCAPVNDNFASKFSIYPNPTDGIVYIDIPESKATVRISDILGKVVKVANLSSNQSSIDLSTLKSGMYFIEIQLSEAKYTSKLTIQ